jgi:cell shape-determining protein MreC
VLIPSALLPLPLPWALIPSVRLPPRPQLQPLQRWVLNPSVPHPPPLLRPEPHRPAPPIPSVLRQPPHQPTDVLLRSSFFTLLTPMTKVLFILSAVVILVASFFAYQNGREFAAVRLSVAGINSQITKEQTADKKIIGEVNQLVADIGRVQGELDIEAEKLKAHKNKLSQAESEATRTQEELDEKVKKQQKLVVDLEKLPKDVKPETITEDIARMKKEKLEFEAQAEAKKKETVAELEKVAVVQNRLAEVVRKIEERRKNFDRNSLTSRVLAVNHDWGFVVIDAGKSTGLTQDTKLIVTRGSLTVGKISVMNVEGTRSMAAIVPDAVINGMTIMPGDRVILENLLQN